MLAAAEMFDHAAHDINPALEQPQNLLPLLVQHQDLDAHDPRDHIFGLLGLYQGAKKSRPLPPLLRPDYERSLTDVCRDATRLALEEQGDLQVLLHLFHRPIENDEDRNFPSWIPRWHRAWDSTIDASRLSYFFRANNGVSMCLLSRDPSTLLLKGILISTIRSVASPIGHTDTENVASLHILFESAERLVRQTGGSSSDSVDNARVGHVLIAGRNNAGQPATEEDGAGFSDFAMRVYAGQVPPTLHGLKASPSTGANDIAKTAHFHNAMRRACTNRRLFVTSSGKLGLGPLTMQENDNVCILFGSSWPVVLRRFGRDYRVIGVCYLEGSMYGEAVREHKLLDREDTTFSLV